MTVQSLFWIVTTFLFGISIGSFLNVVIWRLPRNGSLIDPQWSYCPNCEHRLGGPDLIPLFSFLFLKQRCRYCAKPISWRYFGVELLTGVLFVVVTLRFASDTANWIALLLFGAVMVPVYFIDYDSMTIPDSLNLLAFVIAFGRDVYGIVQHEAGHELVWGWAPRSLLGAAVGMLIFGTVRVLGWVWKRQEAMGLGDVLLARAMGAMLISITPISRNLLYLFPIWVLLACISGIVIGGGAKLLPQRSPKPPEPSERKDGAPVVEPEEPEAEEDSAEEADSTLGREMHDIAWCFWFGDAIEYFQDMMRRKDAPTVVLTEKVDDNWKPAPSAIPFGPFMILGFLATAFFGDPLMAAYLAYAFPHRAGG